jgi:hypothetical protein
MHINPMPQGPAFPNRLHARFGIDKGAIHVEKYCFATEANQKKFSIKDVHHQIEKSSIRMAKKNDGL